MRYVYVQLCNVTFTTRKFMKKMTENNKKRPDLVVKCLYIYIYMICIWHIRLPVCVSIVEYRIRHEFRYLREHIHI